MNKEIVWTKEQEEKINEMIKESEMIGYTQGLDNARKELVKQLEKLIQELKQGIYIK